MTETRTEIETELATWDGLTFDISRVSPAVKSRMRRNRYEGQTIDRIKAYAPKDIPFLNFGAGMGVVDCVHNVQMLHPAQHVAIEGNPEACEINRENRERNGCRYELLNRALAYTSTVEFFVPDIGTELIMAGSKDDRFAKAGFAGRTVSVRSVTLSDIIRERGWERIALCVDVEGAEYDLVDREADVIAKYCDWLIVEWHYTNDEDDPERKRAIECKRKLAELMQYHPKKSTTRLGVYTRKSRVRSPKPGGETRQPSKPQPRTRAESVVRKTRKLIRDPRRFTVDALTNLIGRIEKRGG